MTAGAVFIDRDGTLVHDPGYLADPADVRLLPGSAEALQLLGEAGFARIIITNQSGIGRGFYDLAAFQAVQQEIDRQLAESGTGVDLVMYCPHHPDDGCTCRKPGTALHREAAARLGLPLEGCWCIGDRTADVEPAHALGGRGILVLTGEGKRHETATHGALIRKDLLDAARWIIGR